MISRSPRDASPPSLDVFVVLASPSPVTTAICIILQPSSIAHRHRVFAARSRPPLSPPLARLEGGGSRGLRATSSLDVHLTRARASDARLATRPREHRVRARARASARRPRVRARLRARPRRVHHLRLHAQDARRWHARRAHGRRGPPAEPIQGQSRPHQQRRDVLRHDRQGLCSVERPEGKVRGRLGRPRRAVQPIRTPVLR